MTEQIWGPAVWIQEEHTVRVPTGHAGITRGSSLQPPPKIHFAKANATLALQEAAVLFVCDLLEPARLLYLIDLYSFTLKPFPPLNKIIFNVK